MKTIVTAANAAALTLLASAYANASSLDVDLNNDTGSVQYHLSDTNADLDIAVGGMLTDDKGEVVHFTVKTQGTVAKEQSVRGGFGLRGYYASPDGGDSFQGLGLGGHISVAVPQAPELRLGVELFYVPSITLTDDLDNMRELVFKADYQLFQNASVYLGLRHLEVEQGDFDYEFDEGLHAGFTLQF